MLAKTFGMIVVILAMALLAHLQAEKNITKTLEEGNLSQYEKIRLIVDTLNSGEHYQGVIVTSLSDAPMVNAWASCGWGIMRISVTQEMLNATDNRQLVAIIAHELGHHELQHVCYGKWKGSSSEADADAAGYEIMQYAYDTHKIDYQPCEAYKSVFARFIQLFGDDEGDGSHPKNSTRYINTDLTCYKHKGV